jgi:hypothetical protein
VAEVVYNANAAGGGGGGSSLADTLLTDANGVLFVARDTGTSLTYARIDTGAAYTPVAPLQVAGAASQVSTANGRASRVVVVDPATGNGSLVQAFHNADNQSLGPTSYGIMTGGVDQLLNASGNLDRKRSVSTDGVAATGLAAEVPMLWNGTSYDRAPGSATAGMKVNVGNFPATQPVSGTIGVSTLPALTAGTNLIGDIGVEYRQNATGAALVAALMSSATPAATAAKAAAGRLLGVMLQNSATALRSVKFWNAPTTGVTLGTTPALFEIDIPAGGSVFMGFEGGIGFSTAITYAVTGAKGLTDNTATGLVANDVSGSLVYA